MNCPPIEDLLGPEGETHLATCSACQKDVEDLVRVGQRLRPDDGEFDDPELSRDVGTLIKLGHDSKRPTWRWTRVAVPLAFAAAAAFFLVPRDGPTGFASRGASIEAQDRWVSIDVFVARDGETGYHKAESDLFPDDALAFAIENREHSPYGHVMIFAFDERGRTYWYHPAYLEADTNPVSIAAPAGPTPLNEAVKHELGTGWLRVVGLFSKDALDVKTVEATIAKLDPTSDQRLPFADTGQHSYLFRVVAP